MAEEHETEEEYLEPTSQNSSLTFPEIYRTRWNPPEKPKKMEMPWTVWISETQLTLLSGRFLLHLGNTGSFDVASIQNNTEWRLDYDQPRRGPERNSTAAVGTALRKTCLHGAFCTETIPWRSVRCGGGGLLTSTYLAGRKIGAQPARPSNNAATAPVAAAQQQ